jgi:hypothetical protein
MHGDKDNTRPFGLYGMDNDYKSITSQNKYINYKLLSAQVKLLLNSIVLQNILALCFQSDDGEKKKYQSNLKESSIHFELYDIDEYIYIYKQIMFYGIAWFYL